MLLPPYTYVYIQRKRRGTRETAIHSRSHSYIIYYLVGYLQNRLESLPPFFTTRKDSRIFRLPLFSVRSSQNHSKLNQTLLLRHSRRMLRRRRETLLSVPCTRSRSLRPVVLRLRLVQLRVTALLLLRLCWLCLGLLVVGVRGLALQGWLLLLLLLLNGSLLGRVGCWLLIGLLLLLLRGLLCVEFWA
jgi:hypothetical protein